MDSNLIAKVSIVIFRNAADLWILSQLLLMYFALRLWKEIRLQCVIWIYISKKSIINLELWRYQNKRLKWYFEIKQDQPFVFMERHSWFITSLN